MATPLLNVQNHVLRQAKYYMDKGRAGYRITSDYSDGRPHPILGEVKPHPAVDITGDYGWPALDDIMAIADGEIIKMDRSVTLSAVDGVDKAWRVSEIQRLKQGSGNYVHIKHNSVYQTAYKHMAYATIPIAFKVGKQLKKGDILGYMGTTGMSNGGHLHFEVIENGKYVDPKPFLLGLKSVEIEEGGEEMGYPVLRKDEYVNSEMAQKDTDETRASITKVQQLLVHKFGYGLAIDGKWTDELDRAIRDYQTANGLGVDGRVGPATIKSLNRDLYTEIKELRKAPAPDPSLAKEIEKLKLDKAQLIAEKTQLQTEKANAISNNVKLQAEINSATAKVNTIKSAVKVLIEL